MNTARRANTALTAADKAALTAAEAKRDRKNAKRLGLATGGERRQGRAGDGMNEDAEKLAAIADKIAIQWRNAEREYQTPQLDTAHTVRTVPGNTPSACRLGAVH